MVKRASRKDRDRFTRQRKKLIVFGLEGKNKTEALYLSALNRALKSYVIMVARGNNTDSMSIAQSVAKTIKKENLSLNDGDLAYVMIDKDFSKSQTNDIITAKGFAKKNSIEMLVSNPTFELWYLLHFRYSTKKYTSNAEVLNELRRYISDYTKSRDISNCIMNKTDIAVANAKKLEEFHDRNGTDILERMPSTDVYKLVENLRSDLHFDG